MPIEAKPLFRPDVLRTHLDGFELPSHVEAFRPKLAHWADLLASHKANTFKEQEILPDFLTDFFCDLLGYTRPADGGPRYTISREKHVQAEGEFADAVLGDFGRGPDRFIVALEGKGPKDPLDRPFAGRRMSAVDQGYLEQKRAEATSFTTQLANAKAELNDRAFCLFRLTRGEVRPLEHEVITERIGEGICMLMRM